jgi:glycosyltransferase involved in cell wall biosynthesis
MQLQSLFEQHQCFVFIPTYNNASVIAEVIDKVLRYTDRLLIVNDGSTDDTASVLLNYPQVHQVSYAKNKGKGYALRQGFKYLYNIDCRYVITLDSDGQHKPSDLHHFLEKLKSHPAAIMMGARDMTQSTVCQVKVVLVISFLTFGLNCKPGLTCLIRKQAIVYILCI